MNITQLRTFVAVVEHGSFSEAAKVLGVSQPAVTMQMQSLESDLGAVLLDRGHRKVDLTEAGMVLLPHAREVLSGVDAAREAVTSLSGVVGGQVRIAASTTPGDYVVPRLLGSFVARYPEVRVSVRVDDTSSVISLVESGEADVGVTGATARGARVEFIEVPGDQVVVVCAPGHRLAGVRKVDAAALAGESWVVREPGSGTQQIAAEELGRLGLDTSELTVAVELGTGESVVSAVEGGLGIAAVSRFVADRSIELGTLAEVAVNGFPARRPFFVLLPKRTPTRAAEAFATHLTRSLRGH